jgi:MFS family permease
VLHLSRDRIGGQAIGLTIFATAFLTTRAVGSPLVDRGGGATLARWIVLIEALGFAVLAVASSEWLALVAVGVSGVGLGLVFPSAAAMALARTQGLRLGGAVGALTSFWDIGVLVAGPLGGLAAVRLGYAAAFLIAALMSTAALAVTCMLRERRPASHDVSETALSRSGTSTAKVQDF